MLVRDYGGERHIVTVERAGFAWDGKTYSSLSAIARAITGTAWSGPRFFGTKASGDGGRSRRPPDPSAVARGRRLAPQRKPPSISDSDEPSHAAVIMPAASASSHQ
jgi:hypothetical protein